MTLKPPGGKYNVLEMFTDYMLFSEHLNSAPGVFLFGIVLKEFPDLPSSSDRPKVPTLADCPDMSNL